MSKTRVVYLVMVDKTKVDHNHAYAVLDAKDLKEAEDLGLKYIAYAVTEEDFKHLKWIQDKHVVDSGDGLDRALVSCVKKVGEKCALAFRSGVKRGLSHAVKTNRTEAQTRAIQAIVDADDFDFACNSAESFAYEGEVYTCPFYFTYYTKDGKINSKKIAKNGRVLKHTRID